MRKIKALPLAASIVLVILVGTGAQYVRHLPASEVSELVNEVVARHQDQVDGQRESWLKADKKLTWADDTRQWNTIRQKMLSSGATAQETAKVLYILQSTGIDGHLDKNVFIWPTYAERGEVNGQPVWVFESAWEYCRQTNKGLNVVPIHYWQVAIRGRWPYSVLDTRRCD